MDEPARDSSLKRRLKSSLYNIRYSSREASLIAAAFQTELILVASAISSNSRNGKIHITSSRRKCGKNLFTLVEDVERLVDDWTFFFELEVEDELDPAVNSIRFAIPMLDASEG